MSYNFKIASNFLIPRTRAYPGYLLYDHILNPNTNSTNGSLLVFDKGRWHFRTDGEIFESGKISVLADNYDDDRQIILTYNNPEYIFTLNGFAELILNKLDSKILDLTGDTATGILTFPFLDTPEEAQLLISRLKLRPSQPSTIFCLSRAHGSGFNSVIIKSSSSTSNNIKFTRMTSRIEEEPSNEILLWDRTKGDNNNDKFYFIIKAENFFNGSEKIKIIANQTEVNIFTKLSSNYNIQKLFDIKSFSKHTQYEYNHNNWTLFGKLEGLNGTYSINLNIQKLNIINVPIHNKPNNIFYAAYDKKNEGKSYEANSSVCNVENPIVTFDKNASPPIRWVLSAKSDLLVGEEQYVTIELTNGEFGDKNSTYKISAVGLGKFKDELFEINVIDKLGIINQGLGINSFFANWLTNSQRTNVINDFNGSLKNYLLHKHTEENLVSQGSFYFSLPLLEVVDFTLTSLTGARKDTIELTKISTMWLDNTTQSFDSNASAILSNLKYNFFALTFYDINACMTISQITTITGILHSATFTKDGQENINWDIDKIIVVGSDEAVIKGNKYFTRWNIVLSNPDVIIQVRAEWNDQINHLSNYFEGSAEVDVAFINGANVNNSICWMEISNN
tara:strand:+ start:18567 stop:20426 length:1860 start_codon:yes stop_codon:yes gene_type:complete